MDYLACQHCGRDFAPYDHPVERIRYWRCGPNCGDVPHQECPCCDASMDARLGERGKYKGECFWRCPNCARAQYESPAGFEGSCRLCGIPITVDVDASGEPVFECQDCVGADAEEEVFDPGTDWEETMREYDDTFNDGGAPDPTSLPE